jgi:nucleotide-binding universal stress UspA family protein
MTTSRVIVGVDGSEAGGRALAWALGQASGTDTELVVVTAFPHEGPPEVADRPTSKAAHRRAEAARLQHAMLAAALADMPDPPTVVAKVLPGVPAKVLADESAGADLLVVGSHGHGRLETRLLGTVSSDCVRWSACPVVIIPAEQAAPPEPSGSVISAVMY